MIEAAARRGRTRTVRNEGMDDAGMSPNGQPPVKTSVEFTAEYGGGEYFGETNTLHCNGVHKTNSVKYPGSERKGGEDIEHCKLSKGERFPANWQTPGQPINIDDN